MKTTGTENSGSLKVILIETNDFIRDLLRKRFDMEGFDLRLSTKDPGKLLEYVDQESVDLVVFGNMPTGVLKLNIISALEYRSPKTSMLNMLYQTKIQYLSEVEFEAELHNCLQEIKNLIETDIKGFRYTVVIKPQEVSTAV